MERTEMFEQLKSKLGKSKEKIEQNHKSKSKKLIEESYAIAKVELYNGEVIFQVGTWENRKDTKGYDEKFFTPLSTHQTLEEAHQELKKVVNNTFVSKTILPIKPDDNLSDSILKQEKDKL